MRLLLSVSVLLLTVCFGCTASFPPAAHRADPAESLFVQVLEGGSADRSQALVQLRKDHPESPWTGRARTVAELFRSRESQGLKIKQMEQEKTRCIQESHELQREAGQLREDLEKLRNLLIDVERRATK